MGVASSTELPLPSSCGVFAVLQLALAVRLQVACLPLPGLCSILPQVQGTQARLISPAEHFVTMGLGSVATTWAPLASVFFGQGLTTLCAAGLQPPQL